MSNNEKLAPLMTFTGPAGRTRWDENGALKTVGENEIVEEYDPRTGRYCGTRYEQQAVRLNRPLDATWSRSRIDVTGVLSRPEIDGKITLRKLVPTTENNTHLAFDNTGVSSIAEGVTYVISGYAVADGYEYLQFYLNDSKTLARALAVFDLTRLRVTLDDALEAYIKDLGNGLFYIWASFIGAGTTNNYQFRPVTGFSIAQQAFVGDGSSGIWLGGLQIEAGNRPTSYIMGDGSSIVRARDDARFTNPENFNGFERGTFVVEWETEAIDPSIANHILSRGDAGRFVALAGDGRAYSSIGNAGLTPKSIGFGPHKYAVSFGDGVAERSIDGIPVVSSQWDGISGSGDQMIGKQGWSGWIRSLPYNAEAIRGDQLQRLAAVPSRTTITSGTILGDYDPNERLSLFKDRHGIHPVERDGDPVRFMLDLGPQGNHLQAAPESTGLIYRTDGEKAWIEYNGINDYFMYRAGPVLRGDISPSIHAAIRSENNPNYTYTSIAGQGDYARASEEFIIMCRPRERTLRGYSAATDEDGRLHAIKEMSTPLGAWASVSMVVNSTSLTMYENGVVTSTASSPVPPFSKGGAFRVGYCAGVAGYWKGSIGRITLTADAAQADRDAIDAEIIDRYVSA